MENIKELDSTIDYLEDAFYSLDKAKESCPKNDENYEIIVNAIEELIKSHNAMLNKLQKIKGV